MISFRAFGIASLALLAIILAGAGFILFTPQGADIFLRFTALRMLGPGNVIYERMEGSLVNGVRVFHLEVRRPFSFTLASVVRVEELGMRFKRVSFDGLETKIVNARMMDPRFDPVVINAGSSGPRFNANIYAHGLNLAALCDVIRHYRKPPSWQGDLRDLDLLVSGTLSRLAVKGSFIVDHFPRDGFVLSNAPLDGDVYFLPGRGEWGMFGKVFVHGGELNTARVRLTLGESRLLFSGDAVNPQLDIHASTTVAQTHIDILVKGTRQRPEFHFNSDPPLPEDQIILMLGLAGLSYKVQPQTHGVIFNKDISKRLGFGYGVGVAPPLDQPGQPVKPSAGITQTLQGEYRLTDKIMMGAQKEFRPSAAAGSGATPREIPDERVFIQYHTKF